MTKNPVHHTPYLRNHTSYDCYLLYICIKWQYLQVFFHSLKILIFQVVRGLKGQKMAQNGKNFCLLRSIFQEPYIVWLSNVNVSNVIVQMYKMINLQVFFSDLKFWFSRLSGGWKCKKRPKMTKISVCRTLYIKNYISYDLHLWYTCMYKRIIFPGIFFIFGIIRRRGGGSGKRAKNGPKWQKFCLSHSISQELYII